MSDTPPIGAAPPPPQPSPRRARRIRRLVWVFTAILALAAVLILAAHWALSGGMGARFVAARLDGAVIPGAGQLRVTGLSGDLLDTVHVDRIQLVDDEGPWLTLTDVRLDWRFRPVLSRRLHVEELHAAETIMLRTPRLTPPEEAQTPQARQRARARAGGDVLPVSLQLDALTIGRLVVAEEVLGARGEFTVAADATLDRAGVGTAALSATDLGAAGDALEARFTRDAGGALNAQARAQGAPGGLVAALLRAPAGTQALLQAQAQGRPDNGSGAFRLRFDEDDVATGDLRWDAATAALDARLETARWPMLTALAERAGPGMDIDVVVRDRRDAAQIALTVAAERLDLTATGPLPRGDALRDRGLDVDLTMRELGVWAGGAVDAETAHFAGPIRRGDSGFAGEGALTLSRFDAFTIQAETLTGPATLGFDEGVFRFTANLDGAGVAGANATVDGLLAQEAQAALSGQFDLAARELLFDRIAIASGPAQATLSLDMEFDGDEPGMRLEGEAQGLDLTAIIPQLRGRAAARFQLLRMREGAPMTIEADGRATNIAGAPDVIAPSLGQTVDFSMRGALDEGVLIIERATAEGPGLRLGARGSLLGEAGYALDLEAALQGPLPLPGGAELAGEILGRGAMTGPTDAPVLEMELFADSLTVAGAAFRQPIARLHLEPLGGMEGRVDLTAESGYGPAQGHVAFAMVEGRFSAPQVTLDWADLTVRGGVSAQEDGLMQGALTVRKSGQARSPWPGSLDGELALRSIGGTQGLRVALSADDISFPDRRIWVDDVRLAGEGPLSNLRLTLTAEGIARDLKASVSADGVISVTDTARGAQLDLTAQAGGVTIRSQSPITIGLGPDGTSVRARLGVDDGSLSLDYDTGPDGALIVALLENLPLSVIEAAQPDPRLDGDLNADVRLDTRDGGLSGHIRAQLTDARAVDAGEERIDAELDAQILGQTLTGALDMRSESGLVARAEGALPVRRGEGAAPLAVVMDGPLTGRVTANGPLDTVSSLFLTAEQRLAGQLDMDVALSGAPGAPRFRGGGALTAGRFDDAVSGILLDNLRIVLDYADNQVRISELSADDGRGGTLSGSGSARTADGSWTGEVAAAMRDFQAVNRDGAMARLSGELRAVATAEQRRVEGALRVEEGEFSPPAAGPPGVRTLEVTEINLPGEEMDQRITGRSGPPIDLDIDIEADRRLFLRSPQIDAELSVNANIGGQLGAVRVTGEARVVRGDADLAGRRFVFDAGHVRFAGDPMQAELDFVATREASDLTAVIRVQGTPREPRITLESRPELPQDEILAQVLFGRSATDLSALEAAQLAAALASMAGGGGFDALGGIRSGLGLDRLAIGQNRDGEAMISGGRYLTDDVYLELTTGAQGTAAAQVEWQAYRSFAIISRFGSTNQTSLSVRWRTTY